MPKPQILLDIDGVLNTYPAKPKHMWGDDFQEHKVTDLSKGKEWTLIVGQPVIDFINEINVERADIWWHTTWQASANEVAKAFGISEFPVLDAPEYTSWDRRVAKGWWKLAAVKRTLLDAEAPVIWIDDEAGVYWIKQLHDQCKEAGLSQEGWDRLTVICPDSQSGLSKAHMAKIEHIIDEWND